MARNAIESEFWTSNMADRSEMARNAIESDFRTSKMAAEKKQNLFWPELRSKVNLGNPKWPIQNGRLIESEFRTSKMTDGSHFVKNFQKKLKLRIDLKWPKMRLKVKFGHPKWLT